MATEPVNEAGLVRRITRELTSRYPACWFLKTHGGLMQRGGVLDLLVVVEGRMIGIEVKFQRPGESLAHALGRASKLQLKEVEDLQRAGAVAGVVASVEAAIDLVELALCGT